MQKLITLFYLLVNLRSIVKSDASKKWYSVAFDLVRVFLTNPELLKDYFAFKGHITGNDIRRYISKKDFFRLIEKAEKRKRSNNGVQSLDYSITVKDKFIFNSILKGHGFPCIEPIGLIHNSVYFRKDFSRAGVLQGVLETNGPLVVKNCVLEYNEGVVFIQKRENALLVNGVEIDYQSVERMFKKGFWVVQELIKSHEDIRIYNASALNCTRIVTYWNNNETAYLSGFQAFAIAGQQTDSWGKGAIYVGFDENTGLLTEKGFKHPVRFESSVVREHPDNHISFKNVAVPFLKESVELCVKAHQCFPFTFIIGWDVAITDAGPVIIEGNERPGINAVQIINKGLRSEIENALNSFI